MRLRLRMLLGTLLVVGMVLAGIGRVWRGPGLPVYPVQRSELIQSIVASGRVETPLRVDIGSQITGMVVAVPVAEGQGVTAGQLLIRLDDREASAAVEQASAAVAQSQARLRQLRQLTLPAAQQALRQAEVNLVNMQRQYQRIRQLHSQGFVGEAQRDEAQRNADLAESQLHAARLQVATNQASGSDYLLAQTALEQAQANVRLALARRDMTRIAAPLTGTLIARNVERGDVVQPGKALMVLSPAGPVQLVVQIDEKNLAYLHPGQSALSSADAYPAQRFPAVLSYINPAIDPQRGSVEVKFNVAEAPAYLRQDMTVSVDIEVARRADALVVPIDSVHDSGTGAPWVLQLRDGHAVRQPVRLGVRGTGQVEITAGLQAGDQVIAGLAGAVSEGQRVHPLPARKPAAGP